MLPRQLVPALLQVAREVEAALPWSSEPRLCPARGPPGKERGSGVDGVYVV